MEISAPIPHRLPHRVLMPFNCSSETSWIAQHFSIFSNSRVTNNRRKKTLCEFQRDWLVCRIRLFTATFRMDCRWRLLSEIILNNCLLSFIVSLSCCVHERGGCATRAHKYCVKIYHINIKYVPCGSSNSFIVIFNYRLTETDEYLVIYSLCNVRKNVVKHRSIIVNG